MIWGVETAWLMTLVMSIIIEPWRKGIGNRKWAFLKEADTFFGYLTYKIMFKVCVIHFLKAETILITNISKKYYFTVCRLQIVNNKETSHFIHFKECNKIWHSLKNIKSTHFQKQFSQQCSNVIFWFLHICTQERLSFQALYDTK